MTEKPFGLTQAGELINNETGRVYIVKGISAISICAMLNEIIDENEQLKSEIQKLKNNVSTN